MTGEMGKGVAGRRALFKFSKHNHSKPKFNLICRTPGGRIRGNEMGGSETGPKFDFMCNFLRSDLNSTNMNQAPRHRLGKLLFSWSLHLSGEREMHM